MPELTFLKGCTCHTPANAQHKQHDRDLEGDLQGVVGCSSNGKGMQPVVQLVTLYAAVAKSGSVVLTRWG